MIIYDMIYDEPLLSGKTPQVFTSRLQLEPSRARGRGWGGYFQFIYEPL